MEQRIKSELDSVLAVRSTCVSAEQLLKMTYVTLLVGESHQTCVIMVKGIGISGLSEPDLCQLSPCDVLFWKTDVAL